MTNFVLVIFSFVAILSVLHGIHAVEYTVKINTVAKPTASGDNRFTREIGVRYTQETMKAATVFIWKIFQQNSPADRKNVEKVILSIDDMDGVAYTSDNHIHISIRYIEEYSGDIKREFTGILYHEMAHVWQWSGNGQAPGGLIEGIADYVRLKSGYYPSHWVSPGQGDRWDQGYDVTALFLYYCNSLRIVFIAELNKKLKSGYSIYFFVELMGKPADELWKNYKAKYNTAHK